MLIYTIELSQPQKPPSAKTLHIEGSVSLTEMERLKRIITDALITSDHLILDLTKSEGFPPYLIDQIKSLQSAAKNLGKKITIEEYPARASPFFSKLPVKKN